MSMGTIKVTTADGEEHEVKLEDILKERRAQPASFQVKTLWAAAGVILAWFFTTGATNLLTRVRDLEIKVEQVQISSAEKAAVVEVKFNHIISNQANTDRKQEAMASMLADIKSQLDRRYRAAPQEK